jgi:glucose/arabinose dehydrogenase
LSKTHLATYKGELPPRATGTIQFTNDIEAAPGGAKKYHGCYRHGSNVVFRYTIGGVDVLDMPGMDIAGDKPVFTRALSLTGSLPSVIGQSTALRINRRDLGPLCHGGPALWPRTLTTSGRRGDGSGPFAVDTIAVPENNPWRSWMRLTAFDFFSDGRAAVTTWNGDVWIVSGIDEQLKNVKWKRFAAGLFDPLGLKIVRDEIYVLERHQITRLHDLNNDGEADYYENFNNDAGVSPSYHAFAMDLQTDSTGNFYFTRAGQRVEEMYPLNGGMVRVSANGAKAELIAHGLRAANGMSIGPRDEITCSDNQGNWIPSARINLIQPGKFYGYVPHAHGLSTNNFEPPLCWIPQTLDNSGGGQVWVTSDQWPAALKNHLLHTSYGMAALFDVLWETVDGVAQGGVLKFPLKFDSGIQRARFNPRDGQLYVVGLKGWQTKGVKDGAFQRVRYTGKPLHMPNELHVRRNGIEIGFSEPLERASAEDLQNYSAEQWNYRWTEKYGSDDYSVANPEKKGRDTVNLRAAKLSAGNKHVLLEIPDLKPVMQMKIRFALKDTDGAPVEWEIYNTINRVPQ